MTACQYVTCSSGNCCTCGQCYISSSVTAVSQANETNTTAQLSSASYPSPWHCEKGCDKPNSFCFRDECYSLGGCDGECDNVQDCDTCFCGQCLDNDDQYVTDGTLKNSIGSQAADSPKRPDTFLACLALAAVVLIGVTGLLVIRILNRSKYKKFDSSTKYKATCVETTEMEVETKAKNSEVFF